MKKLTIIMASVVVAGGVAFSQSSSAAVGDKSMRAGVRLGTAPAPGFGAGIGFSVGGGMEVMNNTQLRGDFSYYDWSQSQSGFDIGYTRMLFTVSGRQYFPVDSAFGKLRPYAQAGLQLGIDKAEAVIFNTTASNTAAHIGVLPAAGVEYAITPKISVDAQVGYHIITDSFLSFGADVGYHF